MFITGPDVIKTVTGEEVDFEELGGAMAHNSKSGVAHFAADDEDACLEDTRYLLSLPAAEQPRDRRRASLPTDDPHRMDAELDTVVPDNPNKPYDMRDVDPPRRRRRRVLRGPRALREEHRLRLRAPRRLRDRRRRQPAGAASPACSTSTRAPRPRASCARATRSTSRSLTFVDVPGLPAGHEPGVGRHHPPRREAAVRLHRGDRAEDHRHHAQGLRRRLRRHGLQAPAAPTSTSPGRRPRSRSWAPRARSTSSTAATSPSSPTPDERRAEAHRRLQGALRQPVHGGRARLHRRRDRPPRDAAEGHHRARDAADQARAAARSASTATSRCSRRLHAATRQLHDRRVHAPARAPPHRRPRRSPGPGSRGRSSRTASTRPSSTRPAASPARTAPRSVTSSRVDAAGLDRARQLAAVRGLRPLVAVQLAARPRPRRSPRPCPGRRRRAC